MTNYRSVDSAACVLSSLSKRLNAEVGILLDDLVQTLHLADALPDLSGDARSVLLAPPASWRPGWQLVNPFASSSHRSSGERFGESPPRHGGVARSFRSRMGIQSLLLRAVRVTRAPRAEAGRAMVRELHLLRLQVDAAAGLRAVQVSRSGASRAIASRGDPGAVRRDLGGADAPHGPRAARPRRALSGAASGKPSPRFEKRRRTARRTRRTARARPRASTPPARSVLGSCVERGGKESERSSVSVTVGRRTDASRGASCRVFFVEVNASPDREARARARDASTRTREAPLCFLGQSTAFRVGARPNSMVRRSTPRRRDCSNGKPSRFHPTNSTTRDAKSRECSDRHGRAHRTRARAVSQLV